MENNENRPLLSVIVPVYKVEEYIVECAQSLMNQTLEDIEFIFVDDCSPDRSIRLLEEAISHYPKRRDSVRILRRNVNMGANYTRNEGIAASHGKYLIFCDSDDYVDSELYEQMVMPLEKGECDISVCGFRYFSEEMSIIYPERLTSKSSREMLKMILGSRKKMLIGTLWNKMMRSELWKERSECPGLIYQEDLYNLCQILTADLTVQHSGPALYHYRRRPSSIINNLDGIIFSQTDILVSALHSLLINDSTDKEIIRAAKAKIASLLYSASVTPGVDRSVFSNRYMGYSGYSAFNKRMLPSQKLVLSLAMQSRWKTALFIESFHRLIREIKNKIKKIK